MLVAASVVVSGFFAASSAPAQEHPNVARGVSSQGSGGDADSINPFNGNLSVVIPLGQSFPVNGGLSYGLSLVYNSQVWEFEERSLGEQTFVQSLPSKVNNAGLGWIVTLGQFNPPQAVGSASFRDTYLSPDGSRHIFYPSLHEGEPVDPDFEYTRDSAYLRYKKSTRELEFPDGTIHTFDAKGNLLQIRGRSTGPSPSKKVDVTYLGPAGTPVAPAQAVTWKISDGTRISYVRFRTVSNLPYQAKLVDQVDLPSFNNIRAIYAFRYNLDDATPVTLKGCGNTDTMTQSIGVALLTQVSLPEETTYRMPASDYYPTNPAGPCKSGMLAKLTLPTLGAIAWDYITYQFPTESTMRGYWQRTTGVGTRTLLDSTGGTMGTWGYMTQMTEPLVSGQSRKELVNTTTDPLLNKTLRYFSICAKLCDTADRPYEYGLPFTRERTGDGAGRLLSSQILRGTTPLRTSYVRFERDDDLGTSFELEDKSRLNQRLASQRTAFNDSTGTPVADEDRSDFDGYGHYRGTTIGGTLPGNNTRTAVMGYNPSRGTLGTASFSRWPTSDPWILAPIRFPGKAKVRSCSSARSVFSPAPASSWGDGFTLRTTAPIGPTIWSRPMAWIPRAT
jgi:hypothetical protein